MSELSLEDVSFSYQNSGKAPILSHCSLLVNAKDITILTGPSGCGKSTLLYLAAGLYPENAGKLISGNILFDHKDITKMLARERASFVGMMFQNPELQFCMDTLEQELIFCMENLRFSKEDAKRRIEESIAFCEVNHLRNRKLVTLSGGEKQRAMLACIVAIKPRLILLDEPFANLDEKASLHIIHKLIRLNKEQGIGLLVVDHNLSLWWEVANRVVLFDADGSLVHENLKKTLENESNPSVENYKNEILYKRLQDLGITLSGFEYQSIKPSKSPKENVLSLKQVKVKRSKKESFGEFTYDFKKGLVYSILGESGSGKSTLFDTLYGINDYDGSIIIDGTELKKIPARKRNGYLGYVFQNPQDQFVADTVYDEIALGMKKKGTQEKEIEEILRVLGLWRYQKFSPYMLSQGQQRRLGVAALLTYQCKVLLCDEPTYAQDRKNVIQTMEALQEAVVKHGITLILTTHDPMVARNYADVILELKEGKLHEIHESIL